MSKATAREIARCCTTTGIEIGKKRTIAALAGILQAIYDQPTVATWLDALRRVLDGEHGITGWRPLRPDQLYLLAKVRPTGEDDPHGLLSVAAHARAAGLRSPARGFMTIHRAKGMQFDEVALPYCAGSLFKDDIGSRRRLYVAISRAQSKVHFLIPTSDPTPLLKH